MSDEKGAKGWSTLWQLVSVQRNRLSLAMLSTLFAAVLELVPFWILAQAGGVLIEALSGPWQPETLQNKLLTLALWMAGALAVKTLLYGSAYFFSHQAAFLVLTHTRRVLIRKLASAPLLKLQDYHSGALKQQVLQDVDRIENLIAHHTVEVTVSVLVPVLATLYLFYTDWRIALAALAVVPVALFCSALFMRDMDQMQDQYHQTLAELNKTTVEYLRNITVMKLFRQDVHRFATLAEQMQRYYQLVEAVTRLTVPRWALFTSFLGASLILVLPVGAWLHQNGLIEPEGILLAVLLSGGMLRPLLKVSHFFTDSRVVLARVRRLEPLLELPETWSSAVGGSARRDGNHADDPVRTKKGGEVRIEGVYFAYGHQNILSDLSLTLTAGSTTLLTGRSGSGKSTLAQIIAGLCEPGRGQVSIDGQNMMTVGPDQRVALVALATQETFLFKGSLRDNLLLACDNPHPDELQRALKTAQAATMTEALPKGLDTLIGEDGEGLSGGEKQRVALARALLSDAQLLIFDEATAFADNLTQRAFYRDLKRYYPEKTVLIIAHRLINPEQADQIVVMDKGRIQQVGPHQRLLDTNVWYHKIWQLQQRCEGWSIGRERSCTTI